LTPPFDRLEGNGFRKDDGARDGVGGRFTGSGTRRDRESSVQGLARAGGELNARAYRWRIASTVSKFEV
jgi:hypothetical protein